MQCDTSDAKKGSTRTSLFHTNKRDQIEQSILILQAYSIAVNALLVLNAHRNNNFVRILETPLFSWPNSSIVGIIIP
jgi:hypothetical protein